MTPQWKLAAIRNTQSEAQDWDAGLDICKFQLGHVKLYCTNLIFIPHVFLWCFGSLSTHWNLEAQSVPRRSFISCRDFEAAPDS